MSKQSSDSNDHKPLSMSEREHLIAISAQLSSIQSEIASIAHGLAFLTKVVMGGAGKTPAKTVTTPVVETPATAVQTTDPPTQAAPPKQAAPQEKVLNVKLYFNAIYDGTIKNKAVETLIANAKNSMSPEDRAKLDGLTPAKQKEAMYNIVKLNEEYTAIHAAYKSGTTDNTAKKE